MHHVCQDRSDSSTANLPALLSLEDIYTECVNSEQHLKYQVNIAVCFDKSILLLLSKTYT